MATDKPTADKTDAPPWIERTAGELLRLMGGTISTFIRLFYLPWQSPVVATHPKPAAPPLSFLIVCLLFTGVVVETFILYFGRTVDQGVTSLLANAIVELGPTEITLVTFPIAAMVILVGIGISKIAARSKASFEDPVVRAICYASGVQSAILALFLFALLLSKRIRMHDEVANSYLDVKPLLILFAVLVGSAAIQIERVIAKQGTTFVARYFVFRWPLALSTSFGILIGTLGIGAASFDIGDAMERNKDISNREYLMAMQEEDLGGPQLLHVDELRTAAKKSIGDQLRIEQVVSLTNTCDKSLIVPRPVNLTPSPRMQSELGCPEPFLVESCSADFTGEAGWIIAPGETRLIEWTLDVPAEAQACPGADLVVEFRELTKRSREISRLSPVGEPNSTTLTFLLPALQTATSETPAVAR